MSAMINRLVRKIWPLAASPHQLCCSFCGRDATEVDRLVAGASAHICDACIAQCVAVLEDHGGMPAAAAKIQ